MLIFNKYNEKTGITTTELIGYNYEQVEQSKIKFNELKGKNIVSGNFEDSQWCLTNQVNRITLNFKFDEVLYAKECKQRDMYTFEQFVNSVKSYVVLSIELRSLDTLRQYTHNLIRYLHATNFLNKNYSKKGFETLVGLTSGIIPFVQAYTEYISFSGTEYYSSILEELTDYASNIRQLEKSSRDQRRSLADFQSILMFNDIIEKFWTMTTTPSYDKLKKLYFPLYLWWRITNIIPLRLTEFCVTPYDCVEKTKDGKFYIKLRRSKIKGRHDNKQIHHNLEKDYKICEYIISKEIADLINEYKDITIKSRRDFSRLLCYSTYNMNTYTNRINPDTTKKRYNYTFTRYTFTALVKRFFIDIVHKQFNYNVLTYMDFINERIVAIEDNKNTVITEFKPLMNNQISVFKPGDIRHYAMINLVLNDVSPILIRELVNHEDINTSFHYFGNTSELVKCISYIKYKEICKKEYDFSENKNSKVTNNRIFNHLDSKEYIEVDDGYCTSELFMSGKLDSCVIVDFDCTICDCLIENKTPDKEGIMARLKNYELKMNEQSKQISELLKSYKNTPKINSPLSQNTLLLQNSIKLYSDEVIKNGGIIWEE